MPEKGPRAPLTHDPKLNDRVRPLGREEAAELRGVVRLLAASSPLLLRELLAIIDRRTVADGSWRFAMVGPPEDEFVLCWLADNAKRLRVSLRLWGAFKNRLRTDTQQILMDREEMMRVARASSAHVSHALAELLSIGAVERVQEGRDVRWFLSAKVATHLTGAARDEAQQAAPPLLSAMTEGAPVP